MRKNYAVSNKDIERYQTEENVVVITWDGETKTIETYSRGHSAPIYVGSGMEAARESLELTHAQWDDLLASVVIVIDDNNAYRFLAAESKRSGHSIWKQCRFPDPGE